MVRNDKISIGGARLPAGALRTGANDSRERTSSAAADAAAAADDAAAAAAAAAAASAAGEAAADIYDLY